MKKPLFIAGLLVSLAFGVFFTYELINTNVMHAGAMLGLIFGMGLLASNIYLNEKEDSTL